MANTMELVREQAAHHVASDAELDNAWVSSVSRWMDSDWSLDNPTPGQSRSVSYINWKIPLQDDSTLTDHTYAPLLDSLRRLIWSLFVDPRQSKGLKPGTLGSLAYGLRSLVQWMRSHDIWSLEQLTPDACERYVTESVEMMTRGYDQDVNESTVHNRLFKRFRLLELLYWQSSVLEENGKNGIPSHPFGGISAGTITREFAGKATGWIPPVPDEVALPVMNAAWRMLGRPAEDVLALQAQCLDAYHFRRSGEARSARPDMKAQAARQIVKAFRFSTLEGEAHPWRDQVDHEIVDTVHQKASRHEPLQVFRNLVCDIRDAAVITLQSQVGLRVNEICGLDGTWNDAQNLPACVNVRRSKTGLNDVFYLSGWLSKTRTAKEPVEWVAGLRPVGSTYIPPAVHAVIVLHRLFAPWREMAAKKQLIVGFRHPRGVPRTPGSTGAIASINLLHGLKNFVLKHVDLSTLPDVSALGEDLRPYKDSRGACLRTHQWRKSWALYVYRTDTRMVSAIAQQFKHLSLAMTEQGYIGSDPHLISALDSVERQSAARFFFEAATGRRSVAGNVAKLIEAHRDELLSMIENKSEIQARSAVERWTLDLDLRIWFSEHGKCLIGLSPSSARCHELAGTEHWSRTKPNFETREPSTCAGCSCFAIDGEHVQFWSKRYRTNQTLVMRGKADNRLGDIIVPLARARQAAGVLKALGVKLPEVKVVEAE